MENGFIERRRSPRVPMGSGAVVVRPVSMAVRLLDLSAEGVLLSCPDPVATGPASRVIARLGDCPLDADLDVRHVSKQWDPRIGGYRVGGRFVSLAPPSKRAIDHLLHESERRD